MKFFNKQNNSIFSKYKNNICNVLNNFFSVSIKQIYIDLNYF
jgi:hypothetical protein